MISNSKHIATPKQVTNLSYKKSLGQYFTGDQLAKLLAEISATSKVKSIIDPMAGTGDMLAAFDSNRVRRFGIEYDSAVFEILANRFKGDSRNTFVSHGSAFDPKLIHSLSQQEFDLVITNPPYVRYQSLSKINSNQHPTQIRRALLKILSNKIGINDKERELFNTVISKYSGLSDLAVPSWLLCAMLTKVGGKIAMILPEAWLNREYALIVQYLLLRCFKPIYIIEDANSVWFQDAQVKTTLLVAERISIKDSPFVANDNGYLHVKLFSTATNQNSIVGKMFPNSQTPEKKFKELLEKMSRIRSNSETDFFSSQWVPLKSVADNLLYSSKNYSWISKIQSTSSTETQNNKGCYLPNQIRQIIKDNNKLGFATLDQLGISVGQGIRTGANKFFYVNVCQSNGTTSEIEVSKDLGGKRFTVSKDLLLSVLRKQKEINGGYVLHPERLSGRLLFLEGSATREDIRKIDDIQKSKLLNPLPESFEQYIKAASTKKMGTKRDSQTLPNLSAVKTNISLGNQSKLPRFWYTIPPIAKRHKPDLFIPRVNGGYPRVMLNPHRQAVIDANFSTIWFNTEVKRVNKYSLLALLNSDWTLANLELIGSVMGGGALKVEAVHLKKLPIPDFNETTWQKLSILGQQLTTQKSKLALEKINTLIADEIFPSNLANTLQNELIRLKEQLLSLRSKGK